METFPSHSPWRQTATSPPSEAWMKSTKDNLVRFRSLDTHQEQLTFAITEGRTVLVDQLLSQHPELFYPGNTYHPLQRVACMKKENLEMLQLVWRHFSHHRQTCSPEHKQQMVNEQYSMFAQNFLSKQTRSIPETICRGGVLLCYEDILAHCRTSLMRFLLSIQG